MGGLFVVPVASDNHVTMSCIWPHPSFTGDFLPMSRNVSDEGFTAEWRVNALASSARGAIEDGRTLGGLQSLGVRLIDPITPYPLTDRALKYGFLFIGITFAAFFLFEIIRRLRIHPIQYGFVGFAQALFFLLLLSLSEHIRFGLAYGIAMTATCLLLTIYIGAVLGAFTRGLGFGAMLVLLYGALFGLLQSEDHALMAGSVLLFGLLAAVMVLTRNIDWYALMAPAKPKPPAVPPVPPARTGGV
jgi:inner membrane protein